MIARSYCRAHTAWGLFREDGLRGKENGQRKVRYGRRRVCDREAPMSFISLVPYEHRTGLVREPWVVASPLALHSGHIAAAHDPKEAS